MKRNFTSASEGIVRICHPVLYQELVDIAKDCNVPLQYVFDKFCVVIFEDCDVDTMLIKTVADVENATYVNVLDE